MVPAARMSQDAASVHESDSDSQATLEVFSPVCKSESELVVLAELVEQAVEIRLL